MIDFSLTEAQLLLKDQAHRFAAERVRPVAAEVDRNPDPDSYPFELYAEASQLGFTKILIPEKYGGLGLGLLDLVIIIEELGWGDSGLASSLGVTAFCILLVFFCRPWFLQKKHLACEHGRLCPGRFYRALPVYRVSGFFSNRVQSAPV